MRGLARSNEPTHMLRARIDQLRSRVSTRANRIILLQAALELTRSDDEELERRNARLHRELSRLQAGNGRLRAALDPQIARATVQPRQRYSRYGVTAGTSEGPRRRRINESHPPGEATKT